MPAQPINASLSPVERAFMSKAAQSDMTEIMSSRLALQHFQNAQVRQFAQQMIQQHTESSRKLMAIAQQKSVMLPQAVGAENQACLNKLKPLSGAQFDQAYMSGQVTAHRKAEAEFCKVLQQGQDPAAKAFATQTLPIITSHRQMAEGMVAHR